MNPIDWICIGTFLLFLVVLIISACAVGGRADDWQRVKPPKIEPTPDTEEAQYWLKVRSG